jgi:dienelactone hydrolase
MDAAKINDILDKRVRDLARSGGTVHADDKPLALRKALGLEPLPPRTDLKATVTGVLQRDGYRVEKLRYEAQPGELVTAHLYMPDREGKFPVVLSPHGQWEFKKSTPHVQSRGISLALEGFACLVVDSPGFSWDRNDTNERLGMGTHDDWFLSMATPVQGIYAWDLVRGLDYLETRADCDTSRVGITGSSGGGTATMYAFALDERIKCAVPVCSMASLESATTNGCLCNHVPGALLLGDRSDLLAMRAPAPVMIISATVDPDFPPEPSQRTYEKLRRPLKDNVRLIVVEGPHDYSRRMRESMVAFFREVLLGEPRREFVPELRPLTDSSSNPAPAGTAAGEDPELWVLPVGDRGTITMREMLAKALARPYPEPYDAGSRLVPWGKYGRLGEVPVGALAAIHDDEITEPREPQSIMIPVSKINQLNTIYLGISPAELVAQLLHLSMPGAPDAGDALLSSPAITSVIASVKTLVGPHAGADAPKILTAEGPFSSLVALFLKSYRPEIQIEVSHRWSSWADLLASGNRYLSQPGARYLQFPGG